MTLYRIPDTLSHTHEPESPLGVAMCIRCMLDTHITDGELVPVQRCSHDRYDEHIHTPDGTTKYPTIVGQIETLTICPGAGLEEST